MSGDVIHSMEDIMIKKYGVDQSNSENRMITDMWNWLQREVSAKNYVTKPGQIHLCKYQVSKEEVHEIKFGDIVVM